jgi:hypothetical protein
LKKGDLGGFKNPQEKEFMANAINPPVPKRDFNSNFLQFPPFFKKGGRGDYKAFQTEKNFWRRYNFI